jgi:hypothetical protein
MVQAFNIEAWRPSSTNIVIGLWAAAITRMKTILGIEASGVPTQFQDRE